MDNQRPMRRSLAGQTSLAVLLAFISAPFLHLHAAGKHEHDGQSAHEHETIIHAHLAEADATSAQTLHHDAELSLASHDAKTLGVFAVVPRNASRLPLPFLIEARIELLPACVFIERFVLQSAPRTHDPPLLDPSIPRAPPA